MTAALAPLAAALLTAVIILLLIRACRRDDRRLAAWRLGRSWSALPAAVLPAADPVPVRQVIECGGCGRHRPYCPSCGHKLTVETVPVLERI